MTNPTSIKYKKASTGNTQTEDKDKVTPNSTYT